jgi:hypothetical protein
MIVATDMVERRRSLLDESYTIIERAKKLRALNADPRLVGINPQSPAVKNKSNSAKGKFR